MLRRLYLILLLAVILCSYRVAEAQAPAVDHAPPKHEQPESWIKKKPARWPQLVLTNEAVFDGHTPLHGASAFLMRMPNGDVVVATAKHLIKEAGGVKPPVALAKLDQELKHWDVYPRKQKDAKVEAKGLAIASAREASHDWLLLNLADPKAKLPSTPLTPRAKPAEVGETVYLVGVPYSDHESAQNVYKGIVTARPKPGYFTYDFDPPVRIDGFSGAPIVDKDGLLLGHGVSKEKELKKKGGLQIQFGGEDASLAAKLWAHRSDLPAADPATALHLTLPDGWTDKESPVKGILRLAQHADPLVLFSLSGMSKGDLADSAILMDWAKSSKSQHSKDPGFTDRDETELTPGRIGDRDTIEYQIDATMKGIKFRFRVVFFELNGCFCKATGWTTPSQWDAMQPIFENAVKAIK